MIACADPPLNWPHSRTTTVTYSGTYSATATATTSTVWLERDIETERHRRWRLSLEAIGRHRRAARRIRLRVVSQWRRPVGVARTCSQAERWRVSH